MIQCPRCESFQWVKLFQCAIDPANDRFQCRDCGHKFKRYDPPCPPKEQDHEQEETDDQRRRPPPMDSQR